MKKDSNNKASNYITEKNEPCRHHNKIPSSIFYLYEAVKNMDKNEVKSIILNKFNVKTLDELYKYLDWDVKSGKKLRNLLMYSGIKSFSYYLEEKPLPSLKEYPEFVSAINNDEILNCLIELLFCFTVYCSIRRDIDGYTIYCCYPTRDISYYNEGFINDHQIKNDIHGVDFTLLKEDILSKKNTDLHWHLFKKRINLIVDEDHLDNFELTNNSIILKILKEDVGTIEITDNNNPLNYFEIIPIFMFVEYIPNSNPELIKEPAIITNYESIEENGDQYVLNVKFNVLKNKTQKILTTNSDNVETFDDIKITNINYTELQIFNRDDYNDCNDFQIHGNFLIFLK